MNKDFNLKTDRLLLRPVCIDDAQNVFEYRSDSITNKYQGWIPVATEDVREFIVKVSSSINIPGTWFQFVIILNEDNRLIGDIGIHFIGNDPGKVEIGCTLGKIFQGKGYATEAIEKVISYLFRELNKEKIITSIDPRNSDSINLVERLGLKKEAYHKKSFLLNGEWVDDLVYVISKGEWNDRLI